MKAFLTIIVVSLALLVIHGCKPGSNSTVGDYYMRANVAGDTFDAEGLSKAYLTTSNSGGIYYTYLAGKASNGKFIKLTLISNPNLPITIGTIPVNVGGASADYYPYGLDSGSYTNGISGSIVIKAVSPNYEGTFNFICADSTVVSNGTFSIKAQ